MGRETGARLFKMEIRTHEKSFQVPLRKGKAIGLGFETPSCAKNPKFVDKKCPWTGNVSIRGKVLKGIVISNKMTRTAIVRRNYLHYIPKYKRFEKRHSNIPVHISPALGDLHEGDIVTFGECRPLSKTVRFNALKITRNRIFGSSRKVFKLF